MKPEDYNEQELQQEAPVLFSIEKRNVFQTPDGYFETLSSKIQDRISAEKKISIWEKLTEMFFAPQSLIPAALCAVIIAFIYNGNNYTTDVNDSNIEITYSDLQQSDYIMQMDEQLITDAYLLSDNSSAENELENFLIENNINEDLLNEALNTN